MRLVPVSAASGPSGSPGVPCAPSEQSGERTGNAAASADDAFTLLFRGNYTALCRAVSQVMCGDRAAAEQVVMDAFVILYERRHRVRWETAQPYLWKVAINEARSAARRSGSESRLVVLATEQGFLPGDERRPSPAPEERGVELSHVRDLVAALPLDQRVVVVLHYYCDWPDGRISETLGVPAVTVRSRLRRARKTLERQLQAQERGRHE